MQKAKILTALKKVTQKGRKGELSTVAFYINV